MRHPAAGQVLRSLPACTIVVPTRDRPRQLQACLGSLSRLDYPRERLQVVVVDDGGREALERWIEPFQARLDLTLVRQHHAGPAAARNAGVARARGELLAFTDDDCRPRADWLIRLVSAALRPGADGVGGRTVNQLAGNPFSALAQVLVDVCYCRRDPQDGAPPFLTTNNLILSAEGFRRVGGFDPTFTTAEDRDLCARWRATGLRLAYETGAVVGHAHPLTLGSFCQQFFAYGRGACRFWRKEARAGRPVSVDLPYYLAVARRSLSAPRPRRALATTALLMGWQLANTAGFLWEWVFGAPAARPTACDVLHLLWTGQIGGVETHVAAIVREARRSGARAHRACFLGGRGPVGDALVAEGLADRVLLRGGWDLRGHARLWRLLRRLRPGVVHLRTYSLGAIATSALARPEATVYTEDSPRALRRDVKFRAVYSLLRLGGASFVAGSPAMTRAIAARGVDHSRIVALPHATNVPRRIDDRERRGATVGVVARLEPQKRIDVLLEVVAQMRRRGMDCDGLVVGGGSQLPVLMEHARRLGLSERVRFAGEQDDVTPFLDQIDVFLMTSSSEPFGVAALEAMGRGVPVVAMPCPGGLADLAGRGGLLLPDREVASAARVVAHLLECESARAELRKRGAAVAAEHDLRRALLAHEEFYARHLRAGAARRAPARQGRAGPRRAKSVAAARRRIRKISGAAGAQTERARASGGDRSRPAARVVDEDSTRLRSLPG
jgi:glycosyltransferase involved in cell wall biosynthesis/GT2 family glycosyltransferase